MLKEWDEFFQAEKKKAYFPKLIAKINQERANNTVYPRAEDVFRLFDLIKPEEIKVIIIGQDPYHQKGQANGIAFSTTNDVRTPPSLKNIFKELQDDLQIDHTKNNDLSGWVKQGVFLINTTLTVNKSQPGSHANFGWEQFVNNCLEFINKHSNIYVYVLFGNWAKKTYNNLKFNNNSIKLEFGHPSPFSYYKFFKGTKPFSKINLELKKLNQIEIDWTQ
ncbi:uracil-DNA glycosylase [Williamsoniiplasma lucivorax]|uniref:Uracil-DNA glycosylase n=1 Tax=Williamsoniiplasma lucivorax TaxID=209274 RepID=A0A2S5REW4_9MOLU|nr:uracil-DNA glycosylase [Williamsoniiplasma lucivorax]PPE05866.1 uracil-DNA glycosylase [Williamsoniiplasma lucivorax]